MISLSSTSAVSRPPFNYTSSSSFSYFLDHVICLFVEQEEINKTGKKTQGHCGTVTHQSR